MAEEKPIVPIADENVTRDDVATLAYVLHNVKGSSPVSFTRFQIEELYDEE